MRKLLVIVIILLMIPLNELGLTCSVTSNFISNPGFEMNKAPNGPPLKWSVSAPAGFENACTVTSGGHSGKYRMSQRLNRDYSIYTYQEIKDLLKATYTLTAWVKANGKESNFQMEAKDFGGAKLVAKIPITNKWTQITIPSINITNGQCTVGFSATAKSNDWVDIDDVDLHVIDIPTPLMEPKPETFNAFTKIQAEYMNSASGVKNEFCSEGGLDVGSIENGDSITFNQVDFEKGATNFQARVASGSSGGSIQIYSNGVFIGTCNVKGTGHSQKWTNSSCDIIPVKGIQNLSLKFSGGSGSLFNINWFKFSTASYQLTTSVTGSGSITKNPNKSKYKYGDALTLTAKPANGWAFSGWEGDLTGNVNPISLTMTGNKNVIAVFNRINYNLSITTSGTGSGTVIPDTGPYYYGAKINIKAIPADDSYFERWSGDLSGTVNPTSLTFKDNKAIIAVFTKKPTYSLTISTSGNGNGTVNVDPAPYYTGKKVNITANPALGSCFDHWEGDLTGTTNPTSLIMNSNKTVTAVFKRNTYTIQINTSNGSVTTDKLVYYYGETAKLTPVPANGFKFIEWGGDLTGSTIPGTLIMTGNKSVTAVFKAIYNIQTTAVNGKIETDKTAYLEGETAVLKAVADNGYQFLSWSGDLTGSTNPAHLTMNGNKKVSAIFKAIRTITVTVLNGSVITDKSSYLDGDIAKITAIPAIGYQFSSWQGDLAGSSNPATLVMDGNKAITAVFSLILYSIDSAGTINGKVTTNSDYYAYNQIATLTAVPDAGYQFDHWDGALSGKTNPATLKIDGNKTVTAVFAPIYYTIDSGNTVDGKVITDSNSYTYNQIAKLTAEPNIGYQFDHWDGALSGGINPATLKIDGNKTVTAIFTPIYYTIDSSSTVNGKVITDSKSYTYNQIAELTAEPNIGYQFDHWEGALSGRTNPGTLKIDGNKTVVAVFIKSGYVIDLSNTVNGTILTDNPSYTYNQTAILTAQPNAGFKFDHWEGALTGNYNPATLVMDANKTVTAIFTPIYYFINSSATVNGKVVSENDTYTYNQTATLTAEPDPGYRFIRWEGALSGDTNPVTLKMNENKTVIAVFEEIKYSINSNNTVNGQVDTDCNTYTFNQTATLTAKPNPGYRFEHWEGALSGSTNPATLLMNDNKTVTAVFSQIIYAIDSGNTLNGKVKSDSNTYTYNQIATLTAEPNAGYRFDHWNGALSGNDNPATLRIDDNKTVTAVFEPIYYSIDSGNTKNGKVITDSNTYTYNQTATITAEANPGYRFDHWEGAINGNANPTTLVVDDYKSVVAVFKAIYTITANAVNGVVTIDKTDYLDGDIANITATSLSGFQFDHWEGDLTGSANPANFTIYKNMNITAVFVVQPISNLTAIVDYKNVNLSWNSPFDSTIVVYRMNAINDPNPQLIFNGKGNAWVDYGLPNGHYYYTIYANINGEKSANVITDINVIYNGSTTPSGKTIFGFRPGDGGLFSTLRTALNYRNDDCTYWNGKTLLIGAGVSGRISDMWFRYPKLLGSTSSQISSNALIDRAKLVIKIKNFTGDKEKVRHLKIYQITDPDNLGTPFFSATDGVNSGLNYKYRDSSTLKLWKNGADNINQLIDDSSLVAVIDYLPSLYEKNGIETLWFDVKKSIQNWANGSVNQGWFITCDSTEWNPGEYLEVYGSSTDSISDRPYLEVISALNGDITGPDPITRLNANINENAVDFNWQNPSNSDFCGVKIVRKKGITPRDPDDGELVYDGPANSCRQVGLIAGDTYYYAIFTYDNRRNYSSAVSIRVTPGGPGITTLYEPQTGNGFVNLVWNTPVPGAGSYRVYRQAEKETSISLLATVTGTSYTDYQVAVKKYTYWVSGFNQNGEGPLSNSVSATPAQALNPPSPPFGLTVSQVADNGTQLKLSWSVNLKDATGFVVERRVQGSNDWHIQQVPFNQTTFTDCGLLPNATYFYRIKAVNSSPNSSAYTLQVPGTTSNYLVAPSNLNWMLITLNEIRLSWVDSPNEDHYLVNVMDVNGNLVNVIRVDQNKTFCEVYNLTAYSAYYFIVKAVNSNETVAAFAQTDKILMVVGY